MRRYNRGEQRRQAVAVFDHRFWEVSCDLQSIGSWSLEHGLWYESEESRQDRLDTQGQRAHLLQQIHDAIAEHLTAKQRILVTAYFFDGLTEAEIAARQGVTIATVSQQLFGRVRDGRRIGGAIPRLRKILFTPSH